MRFVRPILTFAMFASFGVLVACGAADHDPTGTDESQLPTGGLGATGDACDIALPGGTKEPGKDNGKGQCCSVLHTDPPKCVDFPKPAPTSSSPGKIPGGGTWGGKIGGGVRR